MEGQVVTVKVPVEGESITDIQNYLASFNKEIQDGAAQVMSEAIDENVTVTGEATTTETTYYVTEDGTAQVAGYQATFETAGGEGGAEQYNGGDGTFYQTTQYYTTVGGDQSGTQYTVQEFHTTDGQPNTKTTTTLLPAGVTHVEGQVGTAGLATVEGGLQQIVLAATDGREVTDSEATEISVTIPAALAGQSGAEELLQAVEAQTDQEGTTYVAVQPNGQRVVVSSSGGTSQVVTVSGAGATSGIGTLISQDGVVHQAQTVGRSQTIRMVVQQADGTEQQQDVEVSTTDGDNIEEVGEGSVVTHGTLQMMANLAEQAGEGEVVGGSEGDDGQQQVLLNSGNSYQTVTIVPSESNPGEVSYVLIVSQPEEEKGEKDSEVDVDMSIYDFNEGEQQGTHEDGEGEEVRGNNTEGEPRERPRPTPKSTRISKAAPKKSQSVTQAHMCNYCNYTSPKRYLLSRHMKSHSEERPHKCSVCERGFKTLASLQNHVNTHTGTRPHQCKECESAFTTSGELVRHVRYKHTHEKPHRCTECEYASVELSKLKRHMRCHTGERPYQCPHCTYASPDTYKLKRHLRIHTGEKPYECDICRARFTQSNSLKAHKLIHTGNKPIFQCELCPTTCGRKTDLRIHVQKLHTSEKPLKCRRCGKSFPDRYTYKVHSKTHEGEKCFKCDLCPYASISQRHLESHMLIHTDQKPYQCDQCEQSFRQKQLLKRHRNLYHNPDYIPPQPKEKTHECSECGRAFRHKGNLIRHMAIHDPDATAQEKEAAMMIHRRYKKKRINEQGIEEEYSEEEEEEDYDEDYDEDDYDDDDDNEISVGRQITTADGQQVVVLEVIQLQGPEGEQQAVAVLAGDGMEMMDASGVADGTTIMTNSDISNTLNAEVIEHATGEIIDGTTTIMVETPRKLRRGNRARIETVADQDGDVMDETQEDAFTASTVVRSGRGRRKKNDDDEDYIGYPSPAKRGRGRGASMGSVGRGRRPKAVQDEASNSSISGHTVEELEAYLPSEEEIARREAEATKRRQEQKRKDLEECFGFKDEDEDDSDQVDTSATESAIQMLAAMQNDDQ